MMTDKEKQEWAAKTVAILYDNPDLKQEFMTAYHTSPAAISAFLGGPNIGMPKELVDVVVKHRNDGTALSNYIGKLVCDFLW